MRRNIGLVFQDTTLDNYLTGEQNLRFHADLYGVPKAAFGPRLRQVLEMVGLWDRRGSVVSTYSGGMQRRLEIARGLLHAPRVLFLDEPTVGLDPQTRASIWEYINELKSREDITIFLTTHYMDEAENCDRIAIIDHGVIVAIDTPEALKASVGRDRVQISTADDAAAIRALAEVFGLEAAVHEGLVTFSVESGEHFVPQAVRRPAGGDQVGERVPALPRRRVHVLHRKDDPRRRGLDRRPQPQDRHAVRQEVAVATKDITVPEAAERNLTELIRVAVPERSIRADLRAVSIVWRRELIRFRTDRLRAITSLVQPVLFLFVLGTGLSRLASRGLPAGVDFRTFIYPGVLAMSVLFTAIFSAASIVWDREFGFLREMLVAPVRRWAIVIGKCLGGATVATFQGLIFLALAGVAHVPYDPVLLLTLVGELLLLSFTLTAFGVMMAARIKQIQAFMALTQLFVLPLFFLSGALYPLNGLPAWLTVLTRIDPLTYVVDPMRQAVFAHLPFGHGAEPAEPRHHLVRLAGPARSVAGHSRRHGPGDARHSHSRVPQDGITIAHCIRCGGIRHPLISKHLLIVSQVLLVSITKSDEQSPPRYATHPPLSGQETLRIALARTKTPTLAPREPNSQLRRKATSPRDPPRARNLSLRRSPEHPQNPR